MDDNPLFALWFAFRKPPDSEQPGVVWLFVPDEEDRLEPKPRESPFDTRGTRVFRPTHITPRIVVQSGWFTVHKWIPDKERFVALEANVRYKSKILRIDVLTGSFAFIREQLARLDIHNASMFPDLGGLADHIEWLHTLYEDE